MSICESAHQVFKSHWTKAFRPISVHRALRVSYWSGEWLGRAIWLLPFASFDTWGSTPAVDWRMHCSGAILQRGTTLLWAHTGQLRRPAATRRKETAVFTYSCNFCSYFIAESGSDFFSSSCTLWKWRKYLLQIKKANYLLHLLVYLFEKNSFAAFASNTGILTLKRWLRASTLTLFSAMTRLKEFWCPSSRPLRLNPGKQRP